MELAKNKILQYHFETDFKRTTEKHGVSEIHGSKKRIIIFIVCGVPIFRL